VGGKNVKIMKYIISESRLENFIFKYLDDLLPVITNYKKAFIFADNEKNSDDIKIFVDTEDDEIGINGDLVKFFENMFSLSYDEVGEIIKKWVESKIGIYLNRFRYTFKISIDNKFYRENYKRI
jgi:hypothetical protein